CLAQNNEILNVDMGIYVNGSGTQLIGNTIQNIAKDGIRGSGGNITLQDNTILDCYNVNDNHDDGIQWYSGVGGTAANVIIRGTYVNDDTSNGTRNFIGAFQGIGCFDDYLTYWTVENNIMLVNHWHGISLYNADYCTLANNTAYNYKYITSESDMATWINFFVGKTGGGGTGNTLVNNLMNSSTSGYNQQVTRTNYTQYYVNTNPSSLDLHLKTGSPAIDAGTSEGAPSVDFDGASRPQGDGYDVGAYEFVVEGNISPVADAGSDQTVVDTDENGSETVSLDGSGSYDPDGTIESYVWKEDGSQIATGATPNVVFDVNYHEVTLEVTDNNSATDTDTVIIIVNTPTAVTSSSTWQNFSIASQTGSFTFEFDTRANNDNMDGVTGVCSGTAAAYTDLACIVRFNPSGYIDVRNGDVYAADVSQSYSAGTNYHVRMEIDISSHTYRVYVTPEGQSEVTLASNYAFRTEQGSVTSLDRWAICAISGSHMVDNAQVGSGTPGTTVMYVNDITMSYKKAGINYSGKATVLIKDEDTFNVEGATVYGNWSGAVSEPDQGTTGSDGKVTLESSKVSGGGTFTFTVTNITKDGYTYDPNQNVETSDSITVP
ncbi:MAG TPA: choice-of-anchor Q domain-containing protein, partial [Sedimentisphaerales bacterium]|nr:choice-of-anchor Q domain-containing protein [Sedimentisphaerales bacterium]